MSLNKILSFILFVSVSVGLQAQEDARKILDDVSGKLLSYNSLQADFSFTLSNEEVDLRDEFEGNLVLSGQKFRLNIMGILAMCDGETMWNYTAELNEASIIDPDESEFFNPVSIFTIYQKGFDLKILKKEGTEYSIELLPNTANEEYERIILRVDHAKKLIRGATYYGTDGNLYEIKISNTIPDIQVDDRFFIFDKAKHPGVTVYDMR